jgi:sporulation protein YlmC with PRC-barrel domain
MLKKLTYATAVLAVLSAPVFADTSARLQNEIPANAVTVTDWYKQNVYDPKDNKIGEVMDVLVNKSGKVETLIVGVGGFLGAGEKDVAVPFDAIQVTNKKDNKTYLVMNTTKEELKSAPGFVYDRNTTTWVADKSAKK